MSISKRKWWLKFYILLLPTADLQFAVPMYPVAPIYAMPAPMPIAIPIPKKTTTTSTTEKNGGDYMVAVAAPYPVPVPMYPPPPKNICFKDHRPKGCPQCAPCPPPPLPLPPPPATFYSMSAYIPIARPPVVVLPYPQYNNNNKRRPRPESKGLSSCSSYSSDTDTSNSDDTSLSSRWRRKYRKPWRKRRRRRRKIGHYKRYKYFRRSDPNKNEDMVKPMLSYVSEDGDVKFQKRLSIDEVNDLVSDNESDVPQDVRVVSGDGLDGKLRIISQVQPNKKSPKHRKSQLLLRSGKSQHDLRDGRKEIVFNPLGKKKITNLSVSFRIA